MKNILFLSFLTIMFWGCTPTKDIKIINDVTPITDNRGQSITTYILKFTAVKNSSLFSASLFKTITASGYLKDKTNHHLINDKSIKIEIINDVERVIYSKIIENPLYRTLEYTEDDKFKKTDIYLDEIFFSIETQNLLNPKMIKISSDLNNKVIIQNLNL